MRARVS